MSGDVSCIKHRNTDGGVVTFKRGGKDFERKRLMVSEASASQIYLSEKNRRIFAV